jgi:hypothetical protein
MTVAITTLRTTIAAALVDNTKYSTFAFPPATPIANSVTLTPSEPYLEPSNKNWATVGPKVNLIVNIYVPLLDNEGNLNGIEDIMVAVFNKLAASSIAFDIGPVSTPGPMDLPTGQLLHASIPISTMTSWS